MSTLQLISDSAKHHVNTQQLISDSAKHHVNTQQLISDSAKHHVNTQQLISDSAMDYNTYWSQTPTAQLRQGAVRLTCVIRRSFTNITIKRQWFTCRLCQQDPV